ncbi:tyrosine-type recombinase/integrase [Brumimicrobium oceani]|uniref:tyrosine-type recombinase/integrase n=1 Tax=Brumimicrobium oceani TaxID=2100725 RepID=UPI0018EEBEEA|nr:tyrosine-type recombinase/integrase [Brumimicrobium oceani]
MKLEDYLNKRHTKGTADRYLRDIQIYQKANPNHKTATYSDIMDYIGKLREQYKNPQSVRTILYSLKKYYSFLVAADLRQDHPCKFINLKDKQNRNIQLQDLFTSDELEQLLDRKERYINLKTKNQVVLSLLIYQGLTTGELTRIELKDLDLEKAEIYIKSSSKLNSRTLKLKSKQILIFHKYITEVRPKIIKRKSNILIINKLGNPETGEQISYLVGTFKHLFLDRNLNPKTIRQSVITNLLKSGNDLRVVQVFSGHKYPSATEKYKQTNVEELKKEVQKYHPLK